MRFRAVLATLLCVLAPGMSLGQTRDPLRLVPGMADAVVKLENPRALYDAFYHHDVVQDFLKIDSVAALYDTNNIRRALQFIAYFEKELGHNRLELLDRLAGGGAVLAVHIEQKKVLVVVQAKDEKLLERFVTLGRKIINQELARQDAKGQVQTRSYKEIETLHLGKELHAARAGGALVFSNSEDTLHKALDLHKSGGRSSLADTPRLASMKSHLPAQQLAWGALNLEEIKKIPNVKNTLTTLGLDPITMFTIGGLVDVIKRAPYVCAGLARDGNNLQVRIAMPKGREGMAPLAAMFLPEGDEGSLPMLQPPRVLSSTSYFLDLGKFWEQRQKILTPEQAKTINKFEEQTGKYLKGIGLGALLQQAGKYHRVVVAVADKSPYKIKPTTETGSFAVVLDMRDPAFGKSMGKVLRGAALVAGFQYGLRLVEEKHGPHTLVTYYFPEKGKFAGDDNNIRFNFSPCFAEVGNQFVICSTLELGKDIIDCLTKETKAGISPATQRTHVFGSGVAANLRSSEDLLVSQVILSQALPTADAKKQFESLIHLVERLGKLQFETRYGPQEFRFDVYWNYDKK